MNGHGRVEGVCFVAAILLWAAVTLEQGIEAADLSLDLATATAATYSKLLSDVRGKVADPKLKYGGTNLPVMAGPSKPPRYLLVEITSKNKATITFAISKNDLYLDAYLDKVEGNYRAHYFSNAPSETKKNIFPEAKGKNRIEMKYENGYGAMEKKAKIERSKLGLGMDSLNKYINQVYGSVSVDVPTEAKLMLVVIQMVSEAARFKYMENMIVVNFATFYNPDPKATRLEIRWSKISKAIKTSKNGVISPELDLLDVHGNPWKVSKVKDIVGDMALLKNEEKALISLFSQIFYNLFKTINNDDDQAEF